jgi:hypothetical protein
LIGGLGVEGVGLAVESAGLAVGPVASRRSRKETSCLLSNGEINAQ